MRSSHYELAAFRCKPDDDTCLKDESVEARFFKIKIVAEDLAGNASYCSTTIAIVPKDPKNPDRSPETLLNPEDNVGQWIVTSEKAFDINLSEAAVELDVPNANEWKFPHMGDLKEEGHNLFSYNEKKKKKEGPFI